MANDICLPCFATRGKTRDPGGRVPIALTSNVFFFARSIKNWSILDESAEIETVQQRETETVECPCDLIVDNEAFDVFQGKSFRIFVQREHRRSTERRRIKSDRKRK